MKKIIVLMLLSFFIIFLLILNHQNGEAAVVEPNIALEQIGSFDNLISKVREAEFSDVGYKRLISVLDKTVSTKDMSIYKSQETTTVLDSLKGKRRLKLFIFKEDRPFMKVEFVGDSPLNIEILFATLVID